jgi:neutral ceramidase
VRRFLTLLGAAACAVLVLHPAVRATSPTPTADPDCQSAFCAGAARGDITPPVTTPMWGYTARELGDHSPDVLQNSADKLAAGDPASALTAIAGDPAVADKLGGDTEGYCKTFECNQGIQIRLYANAFVLRDAQGTKLAVVQVDLGGLPSEVHQAVADRIQAATGIDAAHLLISATHTHQGPGGIFQYQGYALLGGDEFDPRVFAAVVDGISGAVAQADARLVPAKMAWAQTEEAGANSNRRMSQWCLDPEASCKPDGTWAKTGPTPNNQTLTVVRLDAVKDDTPIGVITNLANHGTIGGEDNLLFSGDNQGFATRDVEAGIAEASGGGSGKADPIDALVNGAQGDQSPVADAGDAWNNIGGTRSGYAGMEGAGRNQAAAVLGVWRGLGDKLKSNVSLDARMEQVCFCGQQVSDPGTNYDNDPAWDRVSATPMLGAGGVTTSDPEPTASPTVIPTQGTKLPALAANGTGPQAVRIQQFRIGDLLIGTVPGEPTVQLGRRIIHAMRDAAASSQTPVNGAIVAGLADDYVSYFTTHEEYRSHEYEASFTLYGPQAGELILEQQAALTGALVKGTDVPACTPTPTCPTPTYPSSAAVDPVATTIDGPFAWTVTAPPAASTYETVSVSWVGGSPSAEWRPGLDRVEVQRQRGDGTWEVVAGDALDYATLLSHQTVNGQHIWTAQWEITRDVPAGTYRFHVDGALGQGPGMPTTAYHQDSSSIAVTELTGPCPLPDPASSFRYRGDCSK